MRICFLCHSPYKDEIVRAYKSGINTRRLYEKYNRLIDYGGTLNGFRQMLWKHIKQDHKLDGVVVKTVESKKAVKLDSLVDRLTQLAAVKLEKMDPEDLALRDVFQGHRTLIEYRKLKLGEDAMMLALGKMFGPPMKVVEGEEVHDGILGSGRDQDGGIEPQDPQ